MRSLAPFRISIVALAITASMPALSRAVDTAPLLSQTAVAPSNIVIGFVGGFVRHDNPRHGPVQLAQQIRQTFPKGTYVGVFENRRRKRAYQTVLRLLDSDHDGTLSLEEKTHAHIVLFGHSWGASAAVLLARDLQREGVPVLLTVQVDSVAKMWQNDAIIPGNVAAAVNFYQPHGIIHGRPQIMAADPEKTEILGNFRMDYRKTPVECPQAAWFERTFIPGHMQSECDPHVWSQIEDMVRQRLVPTINAADASTQVPPQP